MMIKKTFFRPCIDLHQGKVRQIVGSTLQNSKGPTINYSSNRPVEWYVDKYKKDNLHSGHIVLLGDGNDATALQALKRWQGAFHLGGGMDLKKANYWLGKGAKKIIFTSWVFEKQNIHWQRLKELNQQLGKEKIVLDISCQKFGKDYYIMTEQWKNKSRHKLVEVMEDLTQYTSDFLIHATSVEGKKQGVDRELISILADLKNNVPITYAGGIATKKDIDYIVKEGKSCLNFTVGSALDIFGGELSYSWLVKNFSE